MGHNPRDDRHAIVLADRRLDRDELLAAADAMAATLQGASTVAVVAEATVEAVTAILAGLARGIPVVPISPDSGPRERQHILRDSGAELLVESGQVTDVEIAESVAATAGPTDAALILYTSGTTGLPKGVPISRAAIDHCLDALAQAWQWTPDDLLVHGLPLHHVHGLVLGVLGPLHVGSGLHHTGRPTPAAYAAAGGSLYFGVPTVWTRLADDPTSARALSTARLLVSGSAALPPSVFDALVTLTGHQAVERYGMTETLITVSARADSPRTPGSVGTPLAGTSTELLDDDDAPLNRDGVAMGHLLVRGPTVFDGYLHGAQGTSFTANGWFRTGDIATIDEDGRHRIVGRAATDLIKSGGYRIGAGEVEDALLAYPSVSEAAVVGLPDDDLGQRIVAFVVATDHDEAALIDFVGQQLSWHKRPRSVVFVDALPRNAMGKVEKARLQGSAGPTMSSPTRG